MDEMIEAFVTPEDAEILNHAKASGIKTVEQFEDLSGLSFFISIPAQLLIRPDLSAESKIIYAMIVGLTRVKGQCSPTNEYLSKISGLSTRSVRRCLIELHRIGEIDLRIERTEAGTWRHLTPLTSKSLYAKFPGLAGGEDKSDRGGDIKNGQRGISNLATQTNKGVKDKETTIPKGEYFLEQFEQTWNNYPRKLGKTNALKAWKRSVKVLGDVDSIRRAMEIYKEQIVKLRTSPEFILHGGTWFGRWSEYLELATAQTVPPLSNADKIKANKCIHCKGGVIEYSEEYGKMCRQCNSKYPVELKIAV